MKKIIAIIAIVALVSALALTLVACGPSGEYKFESMKFTVGAVSTEIVAGEKYMGVTIEKEAVILTIKRDGTYEIKSTIPGATLSESGTWTKDGDEITFDGLFTATKKGRKLTAEYNGATFVLKK